MQFDASKLLAQAAARSGVDPSELTDSSLGEHSMEGYFGTDGRALTVPELIERHGFTGPPPAPETYGTLQGSVSSVVAYAGGSWDGGLEAVVEDCSSHRMARFIGAVVEILSRNPNYIEGVPLDPARLHVLAESIRPFM